MVLRNSKVVFKWSPKQVHVPRPRGTWKRVLVSDIQRGGAWPLIEKGGRRLLMVYILTQDEKGYEDDDNDEDDDDDDDNDDDDDYDDGDDEHRYLCSFGSKASFSRKRSRK